MLLSESLVSFTMYQKIIWQQALDHLTV